MKRFITTNKNIMGGLPCVVGTRIPLSLVLIRLSQGYSLKKLQKDYPWVPLARFEAALLELAEQVENNTLYNPHGLKRAPVIPSKG